MIKRQPVELPPKVAAHVRAKLLAYDWEQQTNQLRTLCEGCPADRDDEICAYCPLEGVALCAAHVAMQAKLAKLEAKSQKTTYSAKIMVADVVRKYKHLEETRLAALADKDAKARAQQDVLADLLDKWDVSIDDAGVDYTRQSWDEV